MSSLIGSIFSAGTEDSADRTLALNLANGIATSSQAYLNAALVATTPEVRRLFAEYSAQSQLVHQALTGLIVEKGWTDPYSQPRDQLNEALQQSQNVVSQQQQQH